MIPPYPMPFHRCTPPPSLPLASAQHAFDCCLRMLCTSRPDSPNSTPQSHPRTRFAVPALFQSLLNGGFYGFSLRFLPSSGEELCLQFVVPPLLDGRRTGRRIYVPSDCLTARCGGNQMGSNAKRAGKKNDPFRRTIPCITKC